MNKRICECGNNAVIGNECLQCIADKLVTAYNPYSYKVSDRAFRADQRTREHNLYGQAAY